MPAQFDSFGIRFLYPDNWSVADRGEDEGDQGATLDFPGGGFFSLELTGAEAVGPLIDRIVSTIAADYEDLEREDVTLDVLPAGTAVTDLRFYYLDLLIISRIAVLKQGNDSSPDDVLLVQMQAESRDFDKNEPVFAAILKQIADAG
ncbi:hypothetical protein Mal15_61250 [Stieleria maiorica]|uniref:DUF1795 domain-containing protein n=1 Tax=Stieleria maiorica TaxID=2795974 RepID=A0A5B9ML33_9BACT|nr:hypothetical protein [Stieleria maiorica]QEG02042.1 hypothetical protein Mal15_61250 [Stieleria maiorica]